MVAAPKPEIRQPVFVAPLATNADAVLHDGKAARGTPQAPAKIAAGALDLRQGGRRVDRIPVDEGAVSVGRVLKSLLVKIQITEARIHHVGV